MKIGNRVFIIFAVVALGAGVAGLGSDTSAQTEASVGKSTISGRAIFRDTEKPIRSTEVLLADEDNNLRRTSLTNSEGEFRFDNIPAGQYRVIVGFPGYAFGTSDLQRDQAPSIAVDGNSNTEITIRAERGGIINGKVVYPDGEPVTGAQVNVFFKAGKRWSHTLLTSCTSQTDDRGVFRIYALLPGEYIVNAVEQKLSIEQRDHGTTRVTSKKLLNPSYYPDAATFKNAKVIQVEAGREVSNIDITINDRPVYKVAGTILGAGKPFAGAALRLIPYDETLGDSAVPQSTALSAIADKKGQWEFRDVPDGGYKLEWDSRASQASASNLKKKFVDITQRVTVAGADLSDLVMSLSEGGRISGTVLLEDGKPPPSSVSVFSSSYLNGSPEHGAGCNVLPASKGAFLIENVLAGENILTVRVVDANYVVKAITWDGQDLLRQPLKVIDGREIRDVRIVLSSEVASLSGRMIQAGTGAPWIHGLFVFVPADEISRRRLDRWLGGRTDRQGGFQVSGAPGEYVLVSLPEIEREKMVDYVNAAVGRGTHITLKPGPQTNTELVAPAP